jgi:hypothetical protein
MACALVLLVNAPAGAARLKTGVLEKKKVDGKSVEVFTDTTFGYALTTPDGWDFSPQKEEKEGPPNPFRVRMKMKDKQIPSQLWDAQNLVTNAEVFLFFVDVDWPVAMVRDSLASSQFQAEWQKPIVKHCNMIQEGQFLQAFELRWENEWHGSGYSLQKQYTAQIPTGDGLFGSVSEVLLGEFYVFPYKGHKMIVHLLSEREFLEDNRNVIKETLYQLGPLQP